MVDKLKALLKSRLDTADLGIAHIVKKLSARIVHVGLPALNIEHHDSPLVVLKTDPVEEPFGCLLEVLGCLYRPFGEILRSYGDNSVITQSHVGNGIDDPVLT